MDKPKDLTPEEIRQLAARAVNQLVFEAEAGRLLNNRELAETVKICLTYSSQEQLRHLRWFLDQKELEGMIPWDKDERAKGKK